MNELLAKVPWKKVGEVAVKAVVITVGAVSALQKHKDAMELVQLKQDVAELMKSKQN